MSELNERVEKDQYIMILDKSALSDEIMNARLLAPGKWTSYVDGWSLFCSNCRRSSLLQADWTLKESLVNEHCVNLICPNCNAAGCFSVSVSAAKRRSYKDNIYRNQTKAVTADKKKEDGWGTFFVYLVVLGFILLAISRLLN